MATKNDDVTESVQGKAPNQMVQAERAHKIKPRDTLNNYFLSEETEDFQNGKKVQVKLYYF